jgi:hypothetical protein
MRLLIALLRDGLPLSPHTNRAVVATLLDWRFERSAAVTWSERLGVQVVYTLALCRALVCSALVECPREVVSPFFRRVWAGVILGGVVLMAFAPVPPLPAGVPPTAVVIYRAAWALPLVVSWLPLLIFLVEVSGRRTRPGPALGSLLGVALVLLLSVLTLDQVDHSRAVVERDVFASASCFAGSSVELSASASCIMRLDSQATRPVGTSWGQRLDVWAALTMLACGLAILGRRIREAGSAHGWVVGLLPFALMAVVLPLAVTMMMYLPLGTFLGFRFAWLPDVWVVAVFAATMMWSAVVIRRRTIRTV